MGLFDTIKDQFLDVIEYEDISNKILVYKYRRESGNDEIKQGSKLIVRQGQAAVFVKEGKIADIFQAGSYTLTTENLPILTTLHSFSTLFVSPFIAEIYFINTRLIYDQKWATKNPIMKKDPDFGLIRLRSFGKYTFKIEDISLFMQEIFGSRGLILSYDIIQYLSSIIVETFSIVLSKSNISALELASQYKQLAVLVCDEVKKRAKTFGISFQEIIIENISLPNEVEKLIDEQSGVHIASQNMDEFARYQTIRAMRDASKQDGSLASLGASFAFGNAIGKEASGETTINKYEELRELKKLLDEGILSQEEFDNQKKKLLK